MTCDFAAVFGEIKFAGLRVLSQAETDWAFCGGRIDRAGVLGDEDLAGGCESAGGGAGRFHEGLPLATGGVGFVTGFAGD